MLSFSTYGQNTILESKYKVELKFIEKDTKELLPSSIIEIFSGKKRIAAGISDYTGTQYFYLKSNEIKNHKITLRVYGLKCKPYEHTFSINKNLKSTIFLEYGKTDFNDRKDLPKFIKKLYFPIPEPSKCGTID